MAIKLFFLLIYYNDVAETETGPKPDNFSETPRPRLRPENFETKVGDRDRKQLIPGPRLRPKNLTKM